MACHAAGALIAGILTSLEVYLSWTPLASSLRRAPFPVHVAVKLMALFGYPNAQENDAERAVRAALAINKRTPGNRP